MLPDAVLVASAVPATDATPVALLSSEVVAAPVTTAIQSDKPFVFAADLVRVIELIPDGAFCRM